MFNPRTGTTFRDVISLGLMGVAAVMILLLPHINPPGEDQEGKPGIEATDTLVFEITWPSGDVDIDQWMLPPGLRKAVGYSNKVEGPCNLLRDDLGEDADPGFANIELIICRGFVPDKEYVWNVHWFANDEGIEAAFIEARVYLLVDGHPRSLFRTSARLARVKEETTLMRFKLKDDGNLDSNSLYATFKKLRTQKKGDNPGGRQWSP